MAESIHSPNFILPTTYDFGSLPNINPTKYSRNTVNSQRFNVCSIDISMSYIRNLVP